MLMCDIRGSSGATETTCGVSRAVRRQHGFKEIFKRSSGVQMLVQSSSRSMALQQACILSDQ